MKTSFPSTSLKIHSGGIQQRNLPECLRETAQFFRWGLISIRRKLSRWHIERLSVLPGACTGEGGAGEGGKEGEEEGDAQLWQ